MLFEVRMMGSWQNNVCIHVLLPGTQRYITVILKPKTTVYYTFVNKKVCSEFDLCRCVHVCLYFPMYTFDCVYLNVIFLVS